MRGSGGLQRLDLAGLLLLVAAIGWAYLVPDWPGFSAGPFAALLLGAAASYAAGRLVASVRATLVPAVVVVGAAMLAITTPDLLSGASLGGPLGYANANGAFFVQSAMASLMLAAASRSAPIRLLGLSAAAAFAIVPVAAKSVTSLALLVLLPLIAIPIRFLAGPRVAVAACAALFISALAATIVLGSTYAPDNRSSSVDRIVDTSLDERRVALWHEALVMMGEHPVTGVGLGGFQASSPTARSDRDARWAHNSFLQQGAESGVMGLVSLTLLFVWGFASVTLADTADTLRVLGAAALAALGIHASVDYILHFPTVPITGAALVGAASWRR